MVRTDYSALTLDKFLNPSAAMKKSSFGAQPPSVVPVTLMSVKKLIYEFENDYD